MEKTPYEISLWEDVIIEDGENLEGTERENHLMARFYDSDYIGDLRDEVRFKNLTGEKALPFDPRTTQQAKNLRVDKSEFSFTTSAKQTQSHYVMQFDTQKMLKDSMLNFEIDIQPKDNLLREVNILQLGGSDLIDKYRSFYSNIMIPAEIKEDAVLLSYYANAQELSSINEVDFYFDTLQKEDLNINYTPQDYFKKIWIYENDLVVDENNPSKIDFKSNSVTFVVGEIYNPYSYKDSKYIEYEGDRERGEQSSNENFFTESRLWNYSKVVEKYKNNEIVNSTDVFAVEDYFSVLAKFLKNQNFIDDFFLKLSEDKQSVTGIPLCEDRLRKHVAANSFFENFENNIIKEDYQTEADVKGNIVNAVIFSVQLNDTMKSILKQLISTKKTTNLLHFPVYNLIYKNNMWDQFGNQETCALGFVNELNESQNPISYFSRALYDEVAPRQTQLRGNYDYQQLGTYFILEGKNIFAEYYDSYGNKYWKIKNNLTTSGQLTYCRLIPYEKNNINYWQNSLINKIDFILPKGEWLVTVKVRARKCYFNDYDQQLVYSNVEKNSDIGAEATCLSRGGYVKEFDDGSLWIPSYYGEKKVLTIGGDKMRGKNRAINPVLERSLTGISSLTFSMYTKYFDENSNQFIRNPFIDLLRNETKIKLNRNNEWFEFLIKDIEENAEEHMNKYTCKDYSATSLGKQGFNIELSKELFNNQGTIQEIAQEVLKESEWRLDLENSDIVLEKQEEALYKVNLFAIVASIGKEVSNSDTGYMAHRLFYNEQGQPYGRIGTDYKSNEENEVKPAATVYMHYSDLIKEWKENELVPCYINLTEKEKIFVIPNDEHQASLGWEDKKTNITTLKKNEDGVIDDWNNIVYFKYFGRRDPIKVTDATGKNDAYRGPGSFSTKEFSNYRSKNIVPQNITKYLPELEKYVQFLEKDGEEYFCYTDVEYITPELSSELIVNGGAENDTEGILSDSGWMSDDYTKNSLNFSSDIEQLEDTKFKETVLETEGKTDYATKAKGYICSQVDATTEAEAGLSYICNTGINSNKTLIKTFTPNDRYILELEAKADYSGTDGTDDTFELSAILENNLPIIAEIEYTASGFKLTDTIAKTIKNSRWNNVAYTNNVLQTGFMTFELEVSKSITERDLKNKNIALVIPLKKPISSSTENKGIFKIYKASLFKKIVDKNNYIISPNYTLRENSTKWPENFGVTEKNPSSGYYKIGESNTVTLPDSETLIKYNIFNSKLYTDDPANFEKDFIEYSYQGEQTPESLKYIEQKTTHKIRNIEAKNSNIFNILQSLSERFGCWCKFRTEFDANGGVVYESVDDKKMPRRFVSFHNEIGNLNPVGINYRVNKKNIQRNINSDAIVTKLIVPDNIVTGAKSGFCSISRASDNISKDNIIYNLNYYIQMGYLDPNTNDDIVKHYENMGKIGAELPEMIEQLSAKETAKLSLESEVTVWENLVTETNEKLNSLKQDFEAIYACDPETLKTQENWPSNVFVGEKIENGFVDGFREDLTNILILENKLGVQGDDTNSGTGYYGELERANLAYTIARNQYKTYVSECQKIKNLRAKTNQEFNSKYGTYLQEGTWSSQDYLDDNKYYHDSYQTLALSSKPQVSYTIDVIDVSSQEGKEMYKYSLGDRTTIEDPEFFGWTSIKKIKDGKTSYIQTPYKEMVVFTSMTESLDDPSQNNITVQNYRTQFEDLFQKMAAETQSLQYKEGSYDNAAGAVDSNGQILPDAIANTFKNSSFIIRNSSDQTLQWGDGGLIIRNSIDNKPTIRIGLGKISIASPEGESGWHTVIDGNGINAKAITTGTLNTDIVNIRNGDTNAFVWNKNGINAYLYDNNLYSLNNKITFNQYGLFGGLNKGTNLSDTFIQRLTEIHRDSRFALTWKGFSLKTGHANSTGYVSIDSDDDITLNVKPNNSSDYLKIIQIGHLESIASTSASDASESAEPTSQSSESGHYGIRVKDMAGNVILETTEEHVNGRFHINCGTW